MKNMLVQKLRIYAMVMRLQELEEERLYKIREHFSLPFRPEPIKLTRIPELESLITLYDKKGKLFELPKSKYHK